MKKLRVLIVEDSLTVRQRLCEALSADPDVCLVGEAENGKEAIELCQSMRPDVISMDMMLPVMSGLTATEYIMAYCPTPILVVSSSFNRGELFKTYEALAAGAVELMEKPNVDDHEEDWSRRYLAMLKLVARVKVVTHLRGRKNGHLDPAPKLTPARLDDSSPVCPPLSPIHPSIQLIAIGASTGGPGAIVEVLHKLPSSLSVPVLIVIHISEPFGSAFAEWLDAQTHHTVHIAREGQLLNKPGVFMAPPNCHLTVHEKRIHMTKDPERFSCRPSVDVLFESVSREYGSDAIGCLLTGMGQDGARGLLEMRRSGSITIAQDEATCVVYGMPREAALLGAAQTILPLSEIGLAMANLLTPAVSLTSTSTSVSENCNLAGRVT